MKCGHLLGAHLLGVMSISFPLCEVGQAQRETASYHGRAMEAERKGSFVEAVELLSVELQGSPHDPHLLYDLGRMYIKQDSLNLGMQTILRSLTIDPTNVSAWNDLGLANARLGRERDAFGFFHRAHHLSPDDVVVRINLARSAYSLGQRALGDDLIAGAIRDSRTPGALVLEAGRVALESNRLLIARSAYSDRRAIALGGTRAWLHAGVIDVRLGNFERATETFQKALDSDPDSPDALGGLGLAWYRLGQPSKAFNYWSRAQAVDSTFFAYHPQWLGFWKDVSRER